MIHNIIGENMEELLWNLFKNTGKIEYYLKYKKIKDENSGSNSRKKI